MAETVIAEVTYYLDSDGQRRLLGLEAEVEGRVIQKCSATPAEQAAFLGRLHLGLRAKLHPGEKEALAYLVHHATEDTALVTGDGSASRAHEATQSGHDGTEVPRTTAACQHSCG